MHPSALHRSPSFAFGGFADLRGIHASGPGRSRSPSAHGSVCGGRLTHAGFATPTWWVAGGGSGGPRKRAFRPPTPWGRMAPGRGAGPPRKRPHSQTRRGRKPRSHCKGTRASSQPHCSRKGRIRTGTARLIAKALVERVAEPDDAPRVDRKSQEVPAAMWTPSPATVFCSYDGSGVRFLHRRRQSWR
jgi:hypothetical protein